MVFCDVLRFVYKEITVRFSRHVFFRFEKNEHGSIQIEHNFRLHAQRDGGIDIPLFSINSLQ